MWQDSWRTDALEVAISSSGGLALVHEEGSAIDGFVCAHDVGFRAYLSELVVSPAGRGRGLGVRLLAEIERRLVERGCSTLIADVWRDAELFYRALGWSEPSVVLLRKTLAVTPA
jgi:ribosomal protein S18 acetylase RimI-like enzyme